MEPTTAHVTDISIKLLPLSTTNKYNMHETSVVRPVVSLLQELLQSFKLAHLQVGFIRVLVADERTADGEKRRRSVEGKLLSHK